MHHFHFPCSGVFAAPIFSMLVGYWVWRKLFYNVAHFPFPFFCLALLSRWVFSNPRWAHSGVQYLRILLGSGSPQMAQRLFFCRLGCVGLGFFCHIVFPFCYNSVAPRSRQFFFLSGPRLNALARSTIRPATASSISSSWSTVHSLEMTVSRSGLLYR